MRSHVRNTLLLGGRSQHSDKVLASDPFAYWILDEKQGAVAYDWVSGRVAGAQNGTHAGVTLAQPGIGDGRTSPLYDGANDYTNIFSAAFAAAFNGAEGTAAAWVRVSAVGVWTDGLVGKVLTLLVDANNQVSILKRAANNSLRYTYEAGGVTEDVDTAGTATTEWMNLAITWSATANQMIAYFNGAQEGAIQVGLGVWAGVLANTNAVIGAQNITPVSVWSGHIAHVAVWDRALPPAEIAGLAVVG